MTLIQLVQYLKREAAIEGTAPVSILALTGILAKAPAWLDEANSELIKALPYASWLWRALSLATSSQTPLSLYTDVGHIDRDSVRWNGVRVHWRDDYRALDEAALTAGTPTWITRLPDETVKLYPAPSASGTLKLEYYIDTQTLDNGTATGLSPLMPAEFHDVLVWRALQAYAYDQGAADLNQRGTDNFSRRLAQLAAQTVPVAIKPGVGL